jgi:hypothetical protein
VEVPFNSYAFVQLEEKDRNLVFNRQERSVIYLVGEAAIVRDEEITIKTGLALDKCDVSRLSNRGQNHPESWPFISQEATVQEIKKHPLCSVLNQYCTLK